VMKLTNTYMLSAALWLTAGALVALAQAGASSSTPVKWNDGLKQKPEWYASDEAVRVADNVLLYQFPAGGWPKNIDMAAMLTEQQRAAIVKQQTAEDESTIDNGATYTQLAFLARVYTA